MKPQLQELVARQRDAFRKRSVAREYLQARILLALQDRGAFAHWAFLGGTALRFLYGLPRYSEDLDFSLVDQLPDFERIMNRVCENLRLETYEVDHTLRTAGAVFSSFVRFRSLPFELGISPHSTEKFSIRVELDTNPPEGAGTATRVVRRHVLLNLFHYDRSSLFAGKLHAVLAREYTKGRDLYDLIWYLSDPEWPEPNLRFLNNALAQTGWNRHRLTAENWRREVRNRLSRVNWREATRDVSPFLERAKDSELVTRETLESLLEE